MHMNVIVGFKWHAFVYKQFVFHLYTDKDLYLIYSYNYQHIFTVLDVYSIWDMLYMADHFLYGLFSQSNATEEDTDVSMFGPGGRFSLFAIVRWLLLGQVSVALGTRVGKSVELDMYETLLAPCSVLMDSFTTAKDVIQAGEQALPIIYEHDRFGLNIARTSKFCIKTAIENQ